MGREIIAATIAGLVSLGASGTAAALCKYKAADGTWTYANSCREKPTKEISGSAALVLQKNEAKKKPDEGLQGQKLQGYEYKDKNSGGMQIRMRDPGKTPQPDQPASLPESQ